MKSILSTNYYVHFQENGYQELTKHLKSCSFSKLILLVDANTKVYCKPLFLEKMGDGFEWETIVLPPGEEFKNIETCTEIWKKLTQLKADRKSLIVNLGGGVITDMGGFIAACFKRGIQFVNIPTTLLSMVDASVGGKTGVDLGPLKNQIGLFSNPDMVLIDHEYLKTVPNRELKSGLAEIIKYGFTFDKDLWNEIKQFRSIDAATVKNLIHQSIEIKNDVVLKDLKENNLRKTLNFGHTIGHAIESYFLENPNKENLTHGEAIAVGMVVELFYSSKLYNFPNEIVDELKHFVKEFYGTIQLDKKDFDEIIDFMIYDKKNVKGKVNFVLLEKFEKCILDVNLNDSILKQGLQYYID